jgi:hypothetical protein
MGDKKISQFDRVSSLLDNSIFLIDQLGSTCTTYLSTLKNIIAGNKITAPTPATDGQVLTYQNSTTSWVASSIRTGGETSDYYDSVPIGSINWFSTSTAPVGYLECAGQIVSKAQYTELWNTIGNTFSAVALSADHFRVPDLRGEFIRGWDHSKGTDTGRVFGSKQDDLFKTHTHTASSPAHSHTASFTDTPYVVYNRVLAGQAGTLYTTEYSQGILDTLNSSMTIGDTAVTININLTGGTETRPRNMALLPCIKAVRTVTTTTNALNFIPKPATASNKQILTYDGNTNTWVASAATVAGAGGGGLKIFDVAGTYSWTAPAGVTRVKITVIGGGGAVHHENLLGDGGRSSCTIGGKTVIANGGKGSYGMTNLGGGTVPAVAADSTVGFSGVGSNSGGGYDGGGTGSCGFGGAGSVYGSGGYGSATDDNSPIVYFYAGGGGYAVYSIQVIPNTTYANSIVVGAPGTTAAYYAKYAGGGLVMLEW